MSARCDVKIVRQTTQGPGHGIVVVARFYEGEETDEYRRNVVKAERTFHFRTEAEIAPGLAAMLKDHSRCEPIAQQKSLLTKNGGSK